MGEMEESGRKEQRKRDTNMLEIEWWIRWITKDVLVGEEVEGAKIYGVDGEVKLPYLHSSRRGGSAASFKISAGNCSKPEEGAISLARTQF